MKKDKEKVIDEVWTEERIRGFLDLEPPPDLDADFHRLRRAYQSMRAEDFALFLGMFVDAGMKLDARGPDGRTLAEEIARHRLAGPYLEALNDAGAASG